MRRKTLSKKEIAVRIDIPRIAMNREPPLMALLVARWWHR
jgi:hypothetical protein